MVRCGDSKPIERVYAQISQCPWLPGRIISINGWLSGDNSRPCFSRRMRADCRHEISITTRRSPRDRRGRDDALFRLPHEPDRKVAPIRVGSPGSRPAIDTRAAGR